MSVLVIDDNLHMRTLVCTLLRAFGVRHFREASDGATALDWLKTAPIDLVIADIHMEPIDGIEFVTMLRRAPDSPAPFIPVIMLTGHSDRNRVIGARDAGVNEFLTKPVTAAALLSRIESIVNRPRPFVRAGSYFGPDRRRRQDPSYTGPRRRGSDTDGVVEID